MLCIIFCSFVVWYFVSGSCWCVWLLLWLTCCVELFGVAIVRLWSLLIWCYLVLFGWLLIVVLVVGCLCLMFDVCLLVWCLFKRWVCLLWLWYLVGLFVVGCVCVLFIVFVLFDFGWVLLYVEFVMVLFAWW